MKRTALNIPSTEISATDLRLHFSLVLRRGGFGQFLSLLRAPADRPDVVALGDSLVTHLRSNSVLNENESMSGALSAADASSLLTLSITSLKFLESELPITGGVNG
ncbi:MAG: hypothetical protein IT290_02695 [Deltaproteobacteria bacterium]|nr:hypothetical protein [Deltaproteobacteria bacterium]